MEMRFTLLLPLALLFALAVAYPSTEELFPDSTSDESAAVSTETENNTWRRRLQQIVTKKAHNSPARSANALLRTRTGQTTPGNAAKCYDSRLATFINNALYYYSHNMGQASAYILDQIKRAGYSGYWFVHAAMIGGQQQGLQWQSQSNGDIFQPTSRHGCYYHDTQTYIVILRY